MTAHGNEPIQEPKRVVILIRPDKPILYPVPPRAQLKPFRMCEDCFEMTFVNKRYWGSHLCLKLTTIAFIILNWVVVVCRVSCVLFSFH